MSGIRMRRLAGLLLVVAAVLGGSSHATAAGSCTGTIDCTIEQVRDTVNDTLRGSGEDQCLYTKDGRPQNFNDRAWGDKDANKPPEHWHCRYCIPNPVASLPPLPDPGTVEEAEDLAFDSFMMRVERFWVMWHHTPPGLRSWVCHAAALGLPAV